MGGGCGIVGLVKPGHPPQLDEGCRNTPAQGQHRFGPGDRYPIPVRIRQHHVAKHVGERLPQDGHVQLRGPGEVRLHGLAGNVFLAKEDFLVGAVVGPPDLHPPLERPQLALVIDARPEQHQVLEQGPRLERGRKLQPGLELRPVGRERVRPRIPGPDPFQVRRELAHLEVFPGRVPVHPDA